MRAVIVDVGGGLVLGEAPDPKPRADQCLVRVGAFSLNRGDLKTLPASVGSVPGWDAAGEVVQVAGAGGGPAPGTRVVTFGWSGGWAELRAADLGELAELPDNVDLAMPLSMESCLYSLDCR